MRLTRLLIILIIVTVHINKIYAQGLIDGISVGDTLETSTDLFTENIRIISRSRKIFVITNTNQRLGKGDFITICFDQQSPIARALVAKNHDGLTGIKVLKIYSLKRWSKLRTNLDVQILKGDDSFLFKPNKEEKKDALADATIETEEDLYNDKFLEGEAGDLTPKDKRLIKPDNVVGASWAQVVLDDIDSEPVSANEFGFMWGYQFMDNYWLEGTYNYTKLSSFPNSGLNTGISKIGARIKYIFPAPLNSYVLPYIGVQTVSVNSPSAGEPGSGVSDEDRAKESQVVSDLQGNKITVGATLLTRMVPGWFVRVDFDTENFALGFSVEF